MAENIEIPSMAEVIAANREIASWDIFVDSEGNVLDEDEEEGGA